MIKIMNQYTTTTPIQTQVINKVISEAPEPLPDLPYNYVFTNSGVSGETFQKLGLLELATLTSQLQVS